MKKILLIFVMIFIFYLSNTPELEVSNPKTWLNEPNYEAQVTDFSFIQNTDGVFYTPYIKDDLYAPNFILHKLSHIFFYSLLTILLFINFQPRKLRYPLVWFTVILFAFTDETHQYFVVGRSGRLYDVILDASASFLTLLVLFTIQLILAIKWRKRTKTNSLNQLMVK